MKKTIAMMAIMIFGLMMSHTAGAEEITIVGTGSGMAILDNVGKAFTGMNPDVTVVVPKSIGSGGGVKAVGSDQAVIGRIARKVKDKEASYGLTYVAMAKLPVVFYTNKSAAVESLTPGQICDIYSGKVTNWSDVGGKGGKIRVVRREDGDSSLSVLRDAFPGFKDLEITEKSKTTNSDSEACELTEKKADTIAFGTLGNAKEYDVTILKIDGKHPTDTDYPYTGELALIYKDKNLSGKVKDFVSFATSDQSHGVIKEAGGMPIR